MKHAGSETHRSFELKPLSIAVLVILAGVGCQTGPSGQVSLDSTVVRLKGAARFSDSHKSWNSAKVGDMLPSGCVVQTAGGSRIDIELGQALSPLNLSAMKHTPANLVILCENSVLRIEQMTDIAFAEKTKLSIRAGWMLGYVNSLTKHSSFEISTSNSIVRTCGGVFNLNVSGEVHVSKGAVTIETSGTSTTIEVTAGHWYDPITASIKVEPETIRCPPPDLDPTDEKFDALSESFERKRTLLWADPPKRRH